MVEAQVKFLINKQTMAWFLKFKCLYALKLNFNGGQFKKKHQNLVISKSGKSHNKIVKFEVDNFKAIVL